MPPLRSSVAKVRAQLIRGREKLQRRHGEGTPGVQLSQAATDLFDAALEELFEAALADLDGERLKGDGSLKMTSSRQASSRQASSRQASLRGMIALAPHSGYGRRDVAPYSDMDLMILYQPGTERFVSPLAARLLQDVFDAGLQLGQSVRSVREACHLARGDASIFSALSEARFLAGNQNLFDDFALRFQQMTRRRRGRLISAVVAARDEERAQYGETVYLLEPNLKRSRGGLRDIQLLRWIGFVTHGVSDPGKLRRLGALSDDDYRSIRDATEFLLQLRNEMHFHAGKAHDVLDRLEQVRLAEVTGYPGRDGLLPVEQFMQEYFDRTNAVSNVVTRFVANARPITRLREIFAPIFSHRVGEDYRVGRFIAATEKGRAKLGELSEVLRLADLANRYDKPIDHSTRQAIRAAARDIPAEISPESAGRFMSLLERPLRLGELLRLLHETTVLERIVPGFAHARSLLQFNEYHKYTVDEHCLRAVERAAEFLSDKGPLGQAYRGIKRKHVLHLALLIHDLGKGYPEDHSEVGRRLAVQTSQRLRLGSRDAATLEFLVHQHLLMSRLAFRRDTSDERLILEFVAQAGSPEVLQMLYVLTCADLAAVGPGVFNGWKHDVLTALRDRAMRHLDADSRTMTSKQRLRKLREDVWRALGETDDRQWFRDQIESLPAAFFDARSTEEIAHELADLQRLPLNEAIVRGRYVPENDTVEYTVSTYENVAPGVFHKLTGGLTSQGLEILSAEINTLARGLIIDRFVVQDNDFESAPPQERLDSVAASLRDILFSGVDEAPTFRKLWRSRQGSRPAEIAPLPTRVAVDNDTSEQFTILDIIATDRTGLLYAIARALFDLELSVSVAKIGTYLDQVVDVFYVTDQSGRKIEDEARLTVICEALVEKIRVFEQHQEEA